MVFNFMFIIIITVLILEILLINTIERNYQENRKDILVSQIKVGADIYQRYYSDTPLYENVLNDVDIFGKQDMAEAQIIDLSGKVLNSSTPNEPKDLSGMKDVKDALAGGFGAWIGYVDNTNEEVMAVSGPLRSGSSSVVGVLRLVTSLEDVNNDIKKITRIFIIIGISVVLICGLLGIILANSIVEPLKEITGVAEKMSTGDYNIRSVTKNKDEIGKLSDTLNHFAEEIVKKEALKNEFISSISHELRTPLTSIKGWAITLKNGSIHDREMMVDGLDIIEKESDRLTSMVEELLDFSKYASGKLGIKVENVNIKELLNYVDIQLTPRAERDNIEFNVTYDDDLPMITSDANRLKQIFINILDNAFRFTPPYGKVSFDTVYENQKLIFRITDTGCGISAEDLPNVKERFYKGKNEKSRNGIGLSICDELIKLMGGEFDIKSELNKGTEVTVVLPVEGVS